LLNKDIYNNTLTDTFIAKTTSVSQKLKPRVIVNWLESKNLQNLTVSVDSNNQHSSTDDGELGSYFQPKQMVNGYDRQSFTWAVAGAKDKNGIAIKSDGQWHCMPSDISDDYEYGWWSGSVSTTSVESTYGGYEFNNNPTVTLDFTSRPCNLIRVFTSEYNGQVHTYRLTIRSSDSGVPNPLYTEVVTMPSGSYYHDHYLPSSIGHSTINRVELEVISTRNPEDYARIHEVNVVYQTDISDDIIDISTDFTRDLHTTELPIGGSGAGSVRFNINNTNKNYNIFNSSSTYGQYMKKNVKVESTLGWQVVKSNSLFIEKEIRSEFGSSDLVLQLNNTDELPEVGGVGDRYVMIIDPDNYTREYVLVESVDDTYSVSVIERGFNNTIARTHPVGTKVVFETYEYPKAVTTYVDEWSSSSDSMTASASCMDWTKFATERIITNGFFLKDATVADAVKNLLMQANFPQADIHYLNTFKKSAREKSAVVHMNFSETVSDRSGTSLPVKNGLRARFLSMPTGKYGKVKDITLDALDRQLTELEKALGESAYVASDYTVNTVDINNNVNNALDLVDFSFTGSAGATVSEYYNMVFDGYYTPPDSGSQYLAVGIAHGGVRVYLEDTLIIDSWITHEVAAGSYTDITSDELDLVAGKPYRIRVECYHTYSTNNSDQFGVYLQYAVGSDPLAVVPIENVYTMAAVDRIGSKDTPFTVGSADRNNNRNNGVYLGEIEVNQIGGISSSDENRSVRFTSSTYMRLPYDISWDLNNSASENYTGNWSIELYIKRATAGFSGAGDYISSFDGASPTGGFEFYADSSEHGFKIKTSSGTESVSVSGTLSISDWSHVLVTYDGTYIKYYLNGSLQDTLSVVGTISSWSNLDLGFGGRNAYYLIGTGEVAPSTLRDFFCDQFVLYNKAMTAAEVSDRYTETQMQELTVYPFLYGNEASAKDIIEEISLADLGRFYIDENGVAQYEHFYAFFEPTIDQHANTQITISDESNIVSADYSVQLQTNKVVVKIAGLSSNLVGVQPLWRADEPTTLAVVNLEANVASNATSITVSSTEDPPFFKGGYLVIDNEIIKYTSKTANSFDNLERGLFGTEAVSHTANTSVREVRYWSLKYDKAPAFEVKDPFITGIQFEKPAQIDILKWNAGHYGAELVISANSNVDKGTFVFAEGTDPVTEKVSFTSVAGTPVLLTQQGSQITEQVADLSDNIRLYGLKEVVIENKFITDFNHGQKIADFIISKMSEPVPILNVQTLLTPTVMIGDKISISDLDAFDIIDGDYWVISKQSQYGNSPSQSLILRKVV